MTVEEVNKIWSEQPIPSRTSTDLTEMIHRQNSKAKSQVYISLAFVVLCLAFGVMNFYGQYFVNGDGLLVASLRFSIVLIVIPIQIQVHRRLVKEYRERVASSANQQDWLSHMVATQKRELMDGGAWKLGLFFAVVLTVVCLTKWLDFQSGADTLTECVVIPLAVVVMMVIVGVGVWHHRMNFLIPEHQRFCRLLEESRVEA